MVAYNRDIPDTPNNPSNDQPKMKQNTNAIDDLISVDHLTFQATNFGTHKQTAFETFSAGPLPGGTSASVAYPAAGVDDPTTAQYYYKNPIGNYILSGVRAFGNFVATVGAVTPTNEFNVNTINVTAGGAITIDLVNGAVTGDSVTIIITKTSGISAAVLQYSFSDPTISIPGSGANINSTINFVVLQA